MLMVSHSRSAKYCQPKGVLVGLKLDLRQASNSCGDTGCVSEQEGEALGREIGASMYVECSALTTAGVRQLFAACAVLSVTARDTSFSSWKSEQVLKLKKRRSSLKDSLKSLKIF